MKTERWIVSDKLDAPFNSKLLEEKEKNLSFPTEELARQKQIEFAKAHKGKRIGRHRSNC